MVQKHGPLGTRISKDLRLLKCGLGEERTAGQNIKQMKKYWKRLENKDPLYSKKTYKRSGPDTLLEENHY